ncbi:hypothetical protein GO491_00675 [Flavobacteriaceae bacterium Ap0902]|nr:hypothetical protein [Flavobacteriaceae bacterium Ap0902]
MLIGTLTFASTGEVTNFDKVNENANNETEYIYQQYDLVGGWCEIRIYCGDRLVGYSYAPANSEGECRGRGYAMLASASCD